LSDFQQPSWNSLTVAVICGSSSAIDCLDSTNRPERHFSLNTSSAGSVKAEEKTIVTSYQYCLSIGKSLRLHQSRGPLRTTFAQLAAQSPKKSTEE